MELCREAVAIEEVSIYQQELYENLPPVLVRVWDILPWWYKAKILLTVEYYYWRNLIVQFLQGKA